MVNPLEAAFPGLAQSGYRITSPKDKIYNCIAWAANDLGNWWWPGPHEEDEYWPPAVPRDLAQRAGPDTGTIPVNQWVDVPDAECNRLSCEAQVIFLHRALEMLPADDRTILKRFPLLDCLRRLRNVGVHFKALDVRQADFAATLSDAKCPRANSVGMTFTGSWFLVVRREDLEETRGPVDQDLFRWFQEQCDKQPGWWILQAAVEQLCAYFAERGRE